MQVRSLTLDVRIWDEAVLGMMERIGNDVANQAWEAELLNENARSGCDSPLIFQEGERAGLRVSCCKG